MFIITRKEKQLIESIDNDDLYRFKRLFKNFNIRRRLYIKELDRQYYIHNYITIKGSLKILKYIYINYLFDYEFKNITKLAIKYNHLHIIKWCLNIELDVDSIDLYCAQYDNTNILNYLKRNNFIINSLITAIATQYDNIRIFKWCVKNKIGIHELTPIYATKYNRLHILKYCHKNNILINHRIGEIASMKGHVHILDWLKRHLYPITYNVYYNSILYSKMEVLDWCLINNYIYDDFLNFLNIGLINEIDLDKKIWRDYLFIEDLSNHRYLELVVNHKREEINNIRQLLLKYLDLPTDIIKYCINPYI